MELEILPDLSRKLSALESLNVYFKKMFSTRLLCKFWLDPFPVIFCKEQGHIVIEPRHEKTNNVVNRTGPTRT